MNYDIAIIGAGVTGAAIARELSKYNLKVCVIEAHSDVCEGTSKANSGITHAGFDAHPGSLKAKLNAAGAKKMEALSKQLDFPYKRNGAMVIAFRDEEIPELKRLAKQSIENTVGELQIIDGDEARKLEPALSSDVRAALLINQSGIVCPFNLTIALAENAATNGVEFRLNTKVVDIIQTTKQSHENECEQGFELKLEYKPPLHMRTEEQMKLPADSDELIEKQSISAKMVINAAGVYGDVIHNMVLDSCNLDNVDSRRDFQRENIIPRRGEYCLYDKEYGNFVQRTIFQVPTKLGKGVLVTPTVHGNLMIGPNAVDLEDKENNTTTQMGSEEVLEKAKKSLNVMPPSSKIITSFAGIRAHRPEDDFLIEELKNVAGFIDVIGIESPGLSCAPAIGEYVVEIVKESASRIGCFELVEKSDWKAERKAYRTLSDLSMEERSEMIKSNSSYGVMVCRCEEVSEGELEDAINRPLGATTLDGLKRRVRPGSGRCQAGFCTPKMIEILAKNLGCTVDRITKSGGESYILSNVEIDKI